MTGKGASPAKDRLLMMAPWERAFQQRQEGVRHFEQTEEMDRQMLFEHLEIAQIVGDRNARMVDLNRGLAVLNATSPPSETARKDSAAYDSPNPWRIGSTQTNTSGAIGAILADDDKDVLFFRH
jgi:hypothetical protein